MTRRRHPPCRSVGCKRAGGDSGDMAMAIVIAFPVSMNRPIDGGAAEDDGGG